MNINNYIYPSLLTLIPMSIAPLFLLSRSKILQRLLVGLLLSLDLTVLIMLIRKMPIDEYPGGWLLRGIHLRFDMLSSIYLILFLSVVGTSLISSFRKNYPPLFYFLTSILLATFNTSAITMDLFNIYVMLELSSIIAYILISLKEDWHNLWASLKYLMISYFAFTMYLTAVGIIYLTNGSLDIAQISSHLPPIIVAMLVIPILLKAGIFPISMWLPAAHSLSPTEVSAILSGSFVKMGSIVLFRLATSGILGNINSIIYIIGFLSAIIAGIMAYHEENAKRLLAFSTMSQMGFVLVGGPLYGSIHALNHGIAKALLFLTIGDQIEDTGHHSIEALKHSKFPMYRYIFMMIGALSIMGFPLFSGFISKTLIVHQFQLWGIFLIIASIATAASMFKVLDIGYVGKTIKLNMSYTILAILIFIPNIWIAKAISASSVTEALAINFLGYILFKWYKSRPLPRILEKLDIMVIEYMLMLLFVWLILVIQR